MSVPKTDLSTIARTGAIAKRTKSHDRWSDRTAGSVSTLPPLTCLSPAVMDDPRSLSRPLLSQPADLSVIELPQLVAKVGSRLAIGEAVWMEGPCLMASTLSANFPLKVIKHPKEVKSTSVVEDIPIEKQSQSEGTKTGTERKSKNMPLTGIELFKIFAKKRHLGELQFYYLKASEDGPYRPYDLQVVPRNKAGSDHYIFSPTSVIHVQDGHSTWFLSLAEWYREAVLWRALKDIPFFRNYLMHKAFSRWKRNVCQIVFQRKQKLLQSQLMIAVPQFREALCHFTRLLEELKEVHWLPQDETRTYTLKEFQATVLKSNQESQDFFKRFLHYRSLLLDMVHETSYKAHQDVQHRIEQSQLNQHTQPMHLQQAYTDSLSRELNQTEHVLQRLGNFAALIDCMTVQSIVTITHSEIKTFLNKVLKREQDQQGSLFQAELIFGADGKLTVFPPMHLFQEVLHVALLSVNESALQVFECCSNLSNSKDPLMADIPLFSTFQDHSSSIDFSWKRSGSVSRASEECFFLKEPFVSSATQLVMPRLNSLRVQGQRVRGQYCPLSRKQLEWHLQLQTGIQEKIKEQARITQEALQEIQQLCEKCSWLVDTRLFTSEWSSAVLDSMRGWPALKYEEHIQKVQFWKEQVWAIPPSFTASNKLLTIICSHIQEKLGPMLTTIEDDTLKFLSDELKLISEKLTSDLKEAVERLGTEPTDFSDFTNYARMVNRYKEMSVEMQQQLDYLCSLQNIIHLNCRNNYRGELTLIEQTLNLWIQFVPLLKQARDTVTQQMPCMTVALDMTFSLLTKELECLVCRATTGPYLDPNQSADQMIADLTIMHKQLNVIVAQLNELSNTSQNLRGHPLDLIFVMTARENIEARKGLWELKSASTAQIQEWKLQLFSKFMVSKAQEKVTEWLQQAGLIARAIPSHDAVLQETLCSLESFNQQLSVLAKLSSPTLKYKHWRQIFKGMGLFCDPEQNLTVADLMTKELLEHQNTIFKICKEAMTEADIEDTFRRIQGNWEGTVFRLAKFILTVWQEDNAQLGVTGRKKSQTNCISTPQQYSHDSGTFTIIGLETLLAQIEDSVMTLSSMMLSPHFVEYRREAEYWVQLLQELEEMLDFCDRYQKKWIFLSKVFYETTLSTQKRELVEKFYPVDKTFREMICFTLKDPHVLNFVRLPKTTEISSQFKGQNLRILFIEGLTAMEEIFDELLYLLDSPRIEFPRLCFLSDGELLHFLTLHPGLSSLLPLVRKCFRGVEFLECNNDHEHNLTDVANEVDLSSTQMWVRGVYGTLREHVPFVCPLEPNLNPLKWLGLLEIKLCQAVKQLILKCTVTQCPETKQSDHELDKEAGGIPSPDRACFSSTLKEDVGKCSEFTESSAFLQLIAAYPLQCLLVADDILWCSEIEKAFHNPAQSRWLQIKSRNSAKLKSLCQAVRRLLANSCDSSLTSQHTVTALRSLVLLTIKHSQQVAGLVDVSGSLESSFEWQRLMKYRHSAIDNKSQNFEDPNCTEHSVYVNILGTQLSYGYEYIGPENWMMVSTPSTDRAFLGILLALTRYKCAFISGPLMSGKEQTVFQLGWALGQQVIILGCCASTSSQIVCQMLCGALQTGAWLVFDSVDSMEQGTLSVLGQHLTDIHQHLSTHQGNAQQKAQELQNHKFSPKTTDEDFIKKHSQEGAEIECQIPFAGSNILAKLSFGCVLISSNGYSTEVPENLRVATRPVSLMQPDYYIIGEVLLLSLGFSEAASMSQHLISFFKVAKDSSCLPDFVNADNYSWLVLLTKVIYASGMHLYREKVKTNGDRFLKWDGQRPADISHKGSDKIPMEMKDHHFSDIKYSIVNSITEEQAVINGITSILLPGIFEQKRVLQLRAIFEEMFPAAKSFLIPQSYIKESEQLLRNAVTEELQQTGFCADTQLLHSAVTLHQTLQFSKAVVLVGPAGSGKTTLYRGLAGALRRLAAKSVEDKFVEDENPKLFSSSRWCSVNMVVLFPNALSHEELFGGCRKESGCMWDGAFTKVIRDTESHNSSVIDPSKINKKIETQNVKWLVLDGEPFSQPGWFDCLSTLSDTRNAFLCLTSGEKVQATQEELKIIVETTSVKDASPSTLARCSLVYVSGKDLWKAVWKVKMDTLYRDHTLDDSSLKIWSCLAEDLFMRTFIFLEHKALNTVHGDGHDNKSSPGITDGLKEITSFIRILHALLKESGKGHGLKLASKLTEKRDQTPKPSFTELQAKNLFVVAYIWGFGGHLHPRHWPQFDLLAREALSECRYKIEVPAEGTVFNHFFNFSDGPLEDRIKAISFARNKSPQLFYTSVPQYEKHVYLLDLMLEARQPALLVGEAGSGKTTLCKSLLQQRPHMHLPANPLLHSADLRNILDMAGHKSRLDSLATIMYHPGLHLFVDDLHEAPFENETTSMLLETLRQSISKGGVISSDGYHFKSFSSEALSFLGTSTLGTNKSSYNQIYPRISRLFTIFVLPSMTEDIVFSVHSTQVQQWLKNFPTMPKIADMAHCIITATFDVYLAVHEHLPLSTHAPHIVFSLHDLQKVFQGMCLWDPKITASPLSSSAFPVFAPPSLGPASNVLNIARLWMHECLRIFGDRLCSDKEKQKLVSILVQVSEKNFGRRLMTESQTIGAEKPDPVYYECVDHLNQHQLLAPSHQDEDETNRSKNEFAMSSMAEVTDFNQFETSECSGEHSSEDSSFFMSESDTDNYSISSRSKAQKSSPKIASFQAESALNTARCSPQSFCLTPSKETKQFENLDNRTGQKVALLSHHMLLEMGSSLCSMVYSPELTELHKCLKQQPFKHNSTYQERDLDMLVQQLAHIIKSKEEKNSCNSAHFAMYRKRVCQLAHILHALLLSGGHGVLFGGTKKTGRKTTVRLAAYLTGFQLFEVHHANESKLKEMLREAGSEIIVHGRQVMFLIHEDISQGIRDKMLMVMATGTDEELKDMIPNISAITKSTRETQEKMKRSLHVVFLMPLNRSIYEGRTGQSSLTVPHITKIISLCSCVEVYQSWCFETLVEIATEYLKQSPEADSQVFKTLQASIAQVMAGIHKSAMKYASTFLDFQQFSPQTYIELMTYFCNFCGHLREQNRGPANRLATVLAQLNDMTSTAQKHTQEVFRLQVKFDETQKWLNQLQTAADTERSCYDQAHQRCLLEMGQLSHLEEQIELAELQAIDALKEVSPLYQAALKSLQSLNQSDLDEVRCYRHPPDGVVILMNAVCMLFNRPCNWESSKQLLGQSNFLQELEFYDRSKLSNELFQKLGQVVQAPNFQPCLVREVSRACESLSCWLQALYQYACVQQHMVPLEAQKIHLSKLMAESRARLRMARRQEETAQNKLEDMKRQLQLVRNSMEELAAQLHKAEAQERDAAAAIKQVSYYAEKWTLAKKETEMNNQTIYGDALILAAALAYLGPFGPDIRLDLLEKWQKACLTGRINITPANPQTALFSGPQSNSFQDLSFMPIPVGMELHRVLTRAVGLDHHLDKVKPQELTRLVLKLLLWGNKVSWAHQWALLADTQHYKELNSQAMQLTDEFKGDVARALREDGYDIVVSAEDPELLNKLSHGVKKGLKVLVTHVEHAVPSKEFLSVLVRPAGSHSLSLFHPVKAPHPEFCLFLSTPLPVRVLHDEIHPLILEKVKVIDLSISTSEVQNIIMTNLLQSECSELWVQHCKEKTDKQAFQDKIQLEEDSLMAHILQSFTPLLQDPEFLPRVSVCQGTSLRLQAEIEKLSNEIYHRTPLLNEFKQLAVLATDLFRAVQDAERLSPFYVFSLHNFLVNVQGALAQKVQPNVTSSGEITGAEISHRIVSHVLTQYRPCLSQSHAEVLRLLVCVVILMHNEGCSEAERITFLKGVSEIQSPDYASTPEQSASELPNWIPLNIQADLHLLEKIPSFNGLLSSLSNSSKQWQEYLRFSSSTVVGQTPCQSHTHLTALQRAILWKTFFPQKLAVIADDLAACQQGQPVASGPHTGSPEELSSFLSRIEGPIIVTLPDQSNDESGSINPLYWIKQVAQCQADKQGAKVTILSFGSQCQTDVVLSALNTAAQTGHWLILNNCHMLDHWDVEVVTQLTQLISHRAKCGQSSAGGSTENHVNPNFRLWFVTKANVPRSVPAIVRINALHLACDSQWDLKDELCSSLRQVVSTTLPTTSLRYTVNMLEPYSRCAVLHSVLLQRQKFRHLGQGSVYNWTQEDLLALVDAHIYIAKHCSDPTGVLEYIAANLIYGGHVSDSADLQALKAVCRVCLHPAPPIWGQGPHTLSEVIMIGCFDEDFMESVERCVQAILNSDDSVILGFGEGMTSKIVTLRSHRLNFLLLRSQGSFAAVRGSGLLNQLQELPEYKEAQERLETLLNNLARGEKSGGVGVGTVLLGPLQTFLQAERDHLIEVISSLLVDCFQPSQDLYNSSYVTSSTILKLETRADLLRRYQREQSDGLCHVYCLSAFANPRGFLAALIRETVHIKQQDVSRVSLHFQVLGAGISSKPSSGICLSGLELHGALWDTRLGALQDTLSSKPCPLPLLWVRAQERVTKNKASNSLSLYNCPLYLDSENTGEDWSLSQENIVTHVPLMARLDPVLCSLRRVRLVSTLEENRYKYYF